MDKINDVRLGELAASATFVFKVDRPAAARPVDVYPAPVAPAKTPKAEVPKKS